MDFGQSGQKNITTLNMKATQIPLTSNNATTGHKLQGTTLDAVYILSWDYSANWPYVVLLRVRTLQGLYLGRPLNPTKDFSVTDT